ncbi:MAG: HAD family phosphatase [Chloroflexi bacterium]|nr:HAD family phosphatase [Chloroflexota bacterium]
MTIHNDSSSEPRGVLWDVDGTLIDSGDYHWLAWHETMVAEGFDLSRDRFAATFGWRNDSILRDWLGADLTEAEIARIGDVKEARYRELMHERGVQPLPGVRRWLEALHAAGWRQAVASSAPRLNVEAILAALEIAHFFEAITSAEDVQRGKPDPQVFLVAAEKLGLPPERCIVVEDAPAGVEGGRRAGMATVGVLWSHPELHADLVTRTLDDLSPDAFDRLLERGTR